MDVLSQTSPCDAVCRMYTHHRRAGPMKRCVADAKVMLLINHGLVGWVRAPETTDLVEGGVVTEKRRTPKDTREHHTQYNRQTTALRSHRPLASGCRRGMQLHSNLQCGVRLLVSTSRTCIEKWHRLVRPIEPHCRRPSAPGRRGVPVGRSGGRCGSTSLVGRGSGLWGWARL